NTIVINTVATEKPASFGIEVVGVKPGLFGFGVVFAAFGIHVFPVGALNVGRAVNVGYLTDRIIPHGVGKDFHVGRAYEDIVAEICIFRVVEIVGVPAGDRIGRTDDTATIGVGAHATFHVVGEVVGGKYGIAINHPYVVRECSQLRFGYIMQLISINHSAVGLRNDHFAKSIEKLLAFVVIIDVAAIGRKGGAVVLVNRSVIDHVAGGGIQPA